MSMTRAIRGLVSFALVGTAACSSSSPAVSSNDAATDTASLTDSPTADVVNDTADATSEALADTAATDAGECVSLGGAYAVTGSCSSPSYSMPSAVCVKQSGCAVTFQTAALTLTGTVTGSRYSVSGTIPGVGVSETCTGDMAADGGASISCAAATISCTGTTASLTIKDQTGTCCDAIAQDCAATSSRCTPVGVGDGSTLVVACIADTGTGDVGASCTRASADPSDVGRDSCKKGLFCANFGNADRNTRTCDKLCALDSDCGAGALCQAFNSSVPVLGVCMPRCTMFAATGAAGACGTGNTCRVMNASIPTAGTKQMNTVCSFIGGGVAGAACTYADDCGAGLACHNSVCSPFCDSTHACTTGTCTPFTGVAPTVDASLGVCQ